MGQQQLLFIVLGVIIVGIAIIVGISMFTASAADAKRNNIVNECVNLAALAHQYYRKPIALGGGGRSFENWEIPQILRATTNGRYEATISDDGDLITISAVGNEVVTGNDSVEVKFLIYPNDYDTEVIH